MLDISAMDVGTQDPLIEKKDSLTSPEQKQQSNSAKDPVGTKDPLIEKEDSPTSPEQIQQTKSAKDPIDAVPSDNDFNYFFGFQGFLDGTPAGDFDDIELQEMDNYVAHIRRPHRLEKAIKEDLKNIDVSDALLRQNERYTKKRAKAIDAFSEINKNLELMSAESDFFARLLTGPDRGGTLKALEETFTGHDLKAGMSAIPEETQNRAKAIHRNMMHYKEHGEWWRTQIGFLGPSQRELLPREDSASQ